MIPADSQVLSYHLSSLFRHSISKYETLHHLVLIQKYILYRAVVLLKYHCQNPFLSAVQANLYL